MPTPPPLARRPQATAFSIEDLLDRVRRGEVRIPDFQRSLRWQAKDVRDLLDSVYRGYPIGTLLFWKKEAPAAVLHFGPVKIDAPQTAQAFWVVDGQQRLTSLTAVLLHPPLQGKGAHDDFAFYFDLESETFVRPPRRVAPPVHWVPMNVVLDSEQLLDWLDRYPGRHEKPHHTRIAMRLGKALREYQVPAYIVETDETQTLRTIFGRLNSAGKPLKGSEIFNALHGSSEEGQPSNLKALAEGLKDMGFGALDTQSILKAVLAVRGLDITRDFKPQLKGQDRLAEMLPATERSLRAAIVFLKRDAGIPHIELLPYRLPLVLLARFFHLHPEPSARSRELLARWVWRGAITELHRGESITQVRRSMQVIGEKEEHSVQQLLSLTTPSTAPDLWNLEVFNFRTARSKLEANALLALQPRDLRSGQLLDIPALLEQEGASAFTRIVTSRPPVRSDMSLQEESGEFFMREITNRIFHPSSLQPSPLALLTAPVPLDTFVLESHGIDQGALDELKKSVWFFLVYRARWLEAHLNQFLSARARWRESDHGSLQSMIVTDEED